MIKTVKELTRDKNTQSAQGSLFTQYKIQRRK